MRIVFFASGEFAIPTLQSLTDKRRDKHEVLCVVTQPDRGAGRGKKAKQTPVKIEAAQIGIPVISADNVNAADVVDRLRDLQADLGLVIAFGQRIGVEVRSLFRHECINLHASLLPAYRGAAPFQWTIINGEEKAGVTTFRLVDSMDAGPVYLHRRTAIKPSERANELHDRLARVGVDAVNATLELLEQDPSFEPRPQDHTKATKAPKLSKKNGHIDFAVPAWKLADLVCGLWSWPGAKCEFVSNETGKTERVTLALARVGDPSAPSPQEQPGDIDYRRYVVTADGYLEILEIKPDGARLMTFQDFVNGRHVKAGDRLQPTTTE